jgi:hypothetical protein
MEDIGNPAGYAMKYLTKAFGTETKYDKGERRYGFSKNRLFAPKKKFDDLSPIEAMERTILGPVWVADLTFKPSLMHPDTIPQGEPIEQPTIRLKELMRLRREKANKIFEEEP